MGLMQIVLNSLSISFQIYLKYSVGIPIFCEKPVKNRFQL